MPFSSSIFYFIILTISHWPTIPASLLLLFLPCLFGSSGFVGFELFQTNILAFPPCLLGLYCLSTLCFLSLSGFLEERRNLGLSSIASSGKSLVLQILLYFSNYIVLSSCFGSTNCGFTCFCYGEHPLIVCSYQSTAGSCCLQVLTYFLPEFPDGFVKFDKNLRLNLKFSVGWIRYGVWEFIE